MSMTIAGPSLSMTVMLSVTWMRYHLGYYKVASPEDTVMSAAPTFKYWQCNKYLSWAPGSLTYQWDGDTVAVTNSNIYCIKTLGTNPAPPEAPVTGRHGRGDEECKHCLLSTSARIEMPPDPLKASPKSCARMPSALEKMLRSDTTGR